MQAAIRRVNDAERSPATFEPDFPRANKYRLRGSRSWTCEAAIHRISDAERSPTTFEHNFPVPTDIAFVGAGAGRAKPPSAALTTPSEAQRRSSRTIPFQLISPSWEPELDVRSRHPPR